VSRRIAKAVLWIVLALPAALMVSGFTRGTLAMDLLHPSGEMSLRLMVLALLPGPLSAAFGPNRFLRGWLSIRRNLGVAAFAYALLHLAFYWIDMASFAAILDEFTIPAIWTGWLSLALLIPPAAISFDRAMRRLGRTWKRIQRLVYAAFFLGILHWLLLAWEWQPAIVHLAPVMLAWFLRAVRSVRRPHSPKGSTPCVSEA
jgi:sulfoxide reductase heme-binding subunit YedZ